MAKKQVDMDKVQEKMLRLLTAERLSGADLRGAKLMDANLSNALFDGAYIADANMSGAILEGAKLEDAIHEAVSLGAALEEEEMIDIAVAS